MADQTFSPEEIDAIRAQARSVMEAEGLSQADVARAAGVAYGTFAGWFAGNYKGNNDRVAGSVQIWLVSRDERKQAAAAVPKPPAFIPTRSAQGFLEALRFAQVMPEIAVIAGGAGIGKTTAARQYGSTNPNVWLATMDPASSGVATMLAELAETIGVVERSAAKLPRAIGRQVAGREGLIIVDEAQHLQPVALDMLRSLYDRYAVGIALVGNETVYARLEGEGRKASFAQLFSRLGMRVTQARPKADDMCALIKAWGVVDAEEARLLKAIARKPGGLRAMTKVLQLATMLAAGAEEDRAIRHIKAAWARHTVTREAEAA